MKQLYPVDIDIQAYPDIDSDDMGQRLVDCISRLSPDNKVINIVKVHVGEYVPAYNLEKLLKTVVVDPLNEMGAKNCIFVPLKQGVIEDITIDRIEVINNASDS